MKKLMSRTYISIKIYYLDGNDASYMAKGYVDAGDKLHIVEMDGTRTRIDRKDILVVWARTKTI